jgi:hypothetical protein
MEKIKITNSSTRDLNIIMEPWADLHKVVSGQSVELVGDFNFEEPIFEAGCLGIVVHDDEDGLGVALYLPEGIKLNPVID